MTPPGRCWCWNEFLVSKVRWDEMDCLLFFSGHKTIFLKNPKHPWDVISYFMLDLVWKYHIHIMYSFLSINFPEQPGMTWPEEKYGDGSRSVPTWPIGLLGLKIIMIEMAIQPWIYLGSNPRKWRFRLGFPSLRMQFHPGGFPGILRLGWT